MTPDEYRQQRQAERAATYRDKVAELRRLKHQTTTEPEPEPEPTEETTDD